MASTEPAKQTSDSSPFVPSDIQAAKKDAIANFHLEQIANLDKGDPTMYEPYWKTLDESFKLSITGSQCLSYFANAKSLCWFLEPELEQEIKILHALVGNAVVEDRHIVVGNGSSQLIQAALYALSEPLNSPNPVAVVSPAPFYSCYPQIADLVKSRLFQWEGDAKAYDKEGAYIEMVTAPNNPDGEMRGAVVNRPNGMLVHDLAYYWPQYTAITSPVDQDVMLFTISKCSGHAGSRIGWAIVKDPEVAKRMVKFIEINTIGVSKEAQLRAASILEMMSRSCKVDGEGEGVMNFFEFGKTVMEERWRKLREALKGNEEVLQLPDFPLDYCSFTRNSTQPRPAYAWLKCREGINLEKALAEKKIKTRGGKSFGWGPEYVRASMLGTEEDFELFLMKLPSVLEALALEQV